MMDSIGMILSSIFGIMFVLKYLGASSRSRAQSQAILVLNRMLRDSTREKMALRQQLVIYAVPLPRAPELEEPTE